MGILKIILESIISYFIFDGLKLIIIKFINYKINKKNIKILNQCNVLDIIKSKYGINFGINNISITSLSSNGLELRLTKNNNYYKNHFVVLIPFNELISDFKLNLFKICFFKEMNLKINKSFEEIITNYPPSKVTVGDLINDMKKLIKVKKVLINEMKKTLKDKDNEITIIENKISCLNAEHNKLVNKNTHIVQEMNK